jgi:hypothetical protein
MFCRVCVSLTPAAALFDFGRLNELTERLKESRTQHPGNFSLVSEMRKKEKEGKEKGKRKREKRKEKEKVGEPSGAF